MNKLAVSTHEQTTSQDIHETTRQLVSCLGVTAVSFLAGAKDSKQASKWQRADGPIPRDEAARRLMAAHRAWRALSSAENEYVARNWFIGANPRLGEISPLQVLREGGLSQVLQAAQAFVEGTDG